MTPKEKAEELVEKYNNLLQKEMACIVYLQSAKDCSLIAVDQVLESIPSLITLEGFGSALFENDEVVWWKQVRQEIENL